MSERIRDAFRQQADMCRAAGSEMTATLLETLARVLDRSTRTGARILDWPTDPIRDALKLRLAGGLHALARSGADPELSALYRDQAGDFDRVLARVLSDHDDRLYPWLDGPPQTNEVGRAGALWPGVMAIAERFGPRVELVELGPSGGLNLNMDRFHYDLGGVETGDPASPVRIAPEWHGPPPPVSAVDVVSRIGVDRDPLDVSRPEIAERLAAFVWPDQPDRLSRIEGAIALARAFPPPIVEGNAADWLEAYLAVAQPEGVTRIVYHSIVLQYFTQRDRERMGEMLAKAGETASGGRPLAWLDFEIHAIGAPAELRLTCWPSGERQLLAHVHPHGAHVSWIAEAS